MDRYGAVIPENHHFDWERFLQGRSIPADDLSELLTSISFWFDGCSLIREDACHSNLPCFVCANKDCKGLSLKFKMVESAFLIVDDPNKTKFRHSSDCHPSFSFRDKEHKKGQILRNSPHLQALFKICFGGPDLERNLTLKNVNAMYLKAGFSIVVKRNLFTELKKYFRELHRKDQCMYHTLLPEYFREYLRLNPRASANLATDDESSFYRMFLSIPDAASVFRNICVPALFIDGTFNRIPEYDGCLVPIIASDGNGGNIPLAVGWIPSENCRGLVYILLMLRRAGFDFDSFPVFSDRGHIRSAVIVLWRELKLVVSVKFCLQHIHRNILHRFKIKSGKRQDSILVFSLNEMQSAPTFATFLFWCRKLQETLPDLGTNILKYLLCTLHPRHWAVFGNVVDHDDGEWEPYYFLFLGELHGLDESPPESLKELLHDPVPLGKKFPLHGFCSTNRVESAQSWLLYHNVRTSTPPLAAYHFLLATKCAIESYRSDLIQKTTPYLTIHYRLFHDTRKDELKYQVLSASPRGNGFVFDVHSAELSKTEQVVFNPDCERPVHCSCSKSAMQGIYCGHIHLVARNKNPPALPENVLNWVKDYFGTVPMWGDRKLLRQFFNQYEALHVPGFADAISTNRSETISPAPAYRRTLNHKNRILSNGEAGHHRSKTDNTSALKSRGVTVMSEPTSRKILSQSNDKSAQGIAEEGFFVFGAEPSEAQVNNLEVYLGRARAGAFVSRRHCSHCGERNHNIQNCVSYIKGGQKFKPPGDLALGEVLIDYFWDESEDLSLRDSLNSSEMLGNDDVGKSTLQTFEEMNLVDSSASDWVSTQILELVKGESIVNKLLPVRDNNIANPMEASSVLIVMEDESSCRSTASIVAPIHADADQEYILDYPSQTFTALTTTTEDPAQSSCQSSLVSTSVQYSMMREAPVQRDIDRVSTSVQHSMMREAPVQQDIDQEYLLNSPSQTFAALTTTTEDPAHSTLDSSTCTMVEHDLEVASVDTSESSTHIPSLTREVQPIVVPIAQRRLNKKVKSLLSSYFTEHAVGIIPCQEQLQDLLEKNEFSISDNYHPILSKDTIKQVVVVVDGDGLQTSPVNEPANTARSSRASRRAQGMIRNSRRNTTGFARELRMFRAAKLKERDDHTGLCITLGENKTGTSYCYNKSRAGTTLREFLALETIETAVQKARDAPIGQDRAHHIDVLYFGCNKISSEDLGILQSQAYLTDDIVNCFVWCITTNLTKHSDVTAHYSQVLNLMDSAASNDGKQDGRINLYSALTAALTMTKGSRCGLQLFPRCRSGHWWLMIVDVEQKIVYSLDSLLETSHYDDAKLLTSLFKICLLENKADGDTKRIRTTRKASQNLKTSIPDMEGWMYQILPRPKNVRQIDCHNCGAYVCHYAASICRLGRQAVEDTKLLDDQRMGRGDELRSFVFDVLFQLADK